MKLLKVYLIFVAFVLQSCSFSLPTGPEFSEQIENRSKEILTLIIDQDFDGLKKEMIPEFLALENLDESLASLIPLLPKDGTSEATVYYTELRIGNPGRETQYDLFLTTYEIQDDQGYVLIGVIVREFDESIKLQHLVVNRYPGRPSTMHNFNFSEKGLKHYIFLTLMIGVVLCIVFSLYKLVRDPTVSKGSKWLWFIFIMLGFWGATMNWTTGNISNNFFELTQMGDQYGFKIRFLDFNLLGAGFARMGLLQPWVMEVGIPIGAIFYWFRRFRQRSVKIP